MKKIVNFLYFTMIFFIFSTILTPMDSCVRKSGHKNQTWQPRPSNKGGQQYKR